MPSFKIIKTFYIKFVDYIKFEDLEFRMVHAKFQDYQNFLYKVCRLYIKFEDLEFRKVRGKFQDHQTSDSEEEGF